MMENDSSRAFAVPSCTVMRDVAAAARPCLSSGTGSSLASAISYHESGHTIVSRFLGLPLGDVTIVPTDEYGGLTFGPGADSLNVTRASLREEAQHQCEWAMELLPPAGKRRDSTTTWWVYAQSQILGLMAGFGAEELAGFSRDLEGKSIDVEIARIYARTIVLSDEAVPSFIASCRTDAMKILKAHWLAVTDAAIALDERQTLDGVEIDAIIYQAEGKASHEAELRRRERMSAMIEKAKAR
jgi:hypothetical protein